MNRKNKFRKTQLFWFLLACFCFAVPSFAQINVKGIITDTENNETLPGATITLKGTKTSVTTDFDGAYTIKAKSNDDILIFAYMGYITKEVKIADKKTINVALVQEAVGLKDVVVMGYSELKRTEISSSVTTLSIDKLRDVTSSNIANMLQGKVAGVQVVSASGSPGSEAQIRVRGISSLTSPKGPLVVVDGIIGGSYDPNDVETITVLKDAGATGMYGSQANSGVIVVTTKKGKSDKVEFDFRATSGIRYADQGNLKVMGGAQLYETQKDLYRDYNSGKVDLLKFYTERPIELKSQDFNWVKTLFRPSQINNYYVSAKQKSEKFSYYLGASFFDEEGTFKDTDYKKVNLRSNTSYSFSKNIKVDNNINLSANTANTYDYMDMFYTYLEMPWDNPYGADGNSRYVDGTTKNWWSRDKINPLHTIGNSEHTSKGFDLNYDFTLSIKLAKWLSFTSANRASLYNNKSHDFVSKLAAGTYHDKGYINEISTMGYGLVSTNLLRFNYKLGLHSFSGLAGYEGQSSYFENLSAEGKGLAEGFNVLNVASGEFGVGGTNEEVMTQSYISQVNYNYNSTYFLTGSYRIDKSSSFSPDNRTAYFPSIAVSWLANNENFLKDVSSIGQLKLRASYGLTGSNDIGPSQYLGLFSLNTQYNDLPAAIPVQLANPELSWEQTTQMNLGLDVDLFDRLSLNFDIYNNITKDLLIQVAQPLSVGFETKWENRGEINNKGIEIGFSTINIKTADFEWATDFNFGKNTNKLSDIGSPIYRSVNGISQIYQDGGQLYEFFLPKWLGVDIQTGAPVWEHLEKDDNGNITSRTPTSDYAQATAQEVGSALPEYQGGFASRMKYKSFTFNVNCSYNVGNSVYNFSGRTMDNDGHEPYYNQMQWKSGSTRWTKPGDIADHPSVQNSALSTEISSRYLQKGDYLKIRNITLRYDFPSVLVNKLKLQGISVAVSAENAFTFTKYWGQDPEVTLSSNSFAMPGVSDFRYPGNKQYVLNLELKF